MRSFLVFSVAVVIVVVLSVIVFMDEVFSAEVQYKTVSTRTDEKGKYENVERGGQTEDAILRRHRDGEDYEIKYRDGWVTKVTWE